MKKIIKFGAGLTAACIALSIVLHNPQIATAKAKFSVDVSKRQDFCTDDKGYPLSKINKQESIHIRIGVSQMRQNTKLNVFIVDDKVKSLKKLKQRGGALRFKVIFPKTELCYEEDIQCLFTQNRAWFDTPGLAATSCVACHAGDDGIPPEQCPPECHLMDLGTVAGMKAGADGGAEPILGESFVGATDYDWGHSGLRRRLRNNRMPPGSPFFIDESNRNGPDITTNPDGNDLAMVDPVSNIQSDFYIKVKPGGDYKYGGNNHAVGAIAAWVAGTNAGLNEGNVVPYNGDPDVDWYDIAPFFTAPNTWFNGAITCIACHYCNQEPPCFHTLDFRTAAGLRAGADGGTEPILGESFVGATDYDWGHSGLKTRLRNNRMPPEAPFVLDESNRNGPWVHHSVTNGYTSAVQLIGEWVDNDLPSCPDDNHGARK